MDDEVERAFDTIKSKLIEQQDELETATARITALERKLKVASDCLWWVVEKGQTTKEIKYAVVRAVTEIKE